MGVSPPEVRLERYPEAVAMLERGEADERLETALALIGAGVRGVDIGAELGIARSTVYALLHDPYGDKAITRKRQARAGSAAEPRGRALTAAPRSARTGRAASRAHQKATARWNRETIIEAMHRWEREAGKQKEVASSLKAETVIEREIARYEARKTKAQETVEECEEQAKRLKLALTALTNGHAE